MAVHRLISRSARSFARWPPQTHCGARRGFTGNYARSASTSQSARSRVCWNRTHARRRRRGGRFSRIISRQPCRWISSPCRRRRSRAVRLDRAVAPSSTHRTFQHHRASDRPVDCPTSRRRIPGRHRAQMVASRSRQRLQRALPASSGGHGHRRSRLSPGESLAESVRGPRDRLNPPRMPGSRDRAQSGASAARPHDLRPVRSSESDTSWAREGRARCPSSLDNRPWADHRDSGSRRPSSSLRTAGGVSARPARRASVLDISAERARITRSSVSSSIRRRRERTSIHRWKRWSKAWLYGTLGLFAEYRVAR